MESVGPYRIDALVGRGKAGSVWRATRSGAVVQEVAIKRARTATGAEGAERLRHEARILADLDHPHIVRVVDVLDDGDEVAIVMSLARGGSLHDLLVERGRLPPGATVAVLARIADALGSAHRRGVLHGDVKPANILFTTDGEPLLGDFGVAQHLTPDRAGLAGVGGLHTVEGTTGYVDPELVATGHPEPRNDVYGLSVVAYLCLTGRLPHPGSTSREVLAAADAGAHPPLVDDPSVPPALAAVVDAGLARDPARRPATAEDVARGLRAGVDPVTIVLPGIALSGAGPLAEATGSDVVAGRGVVGEAESGPVGSPSAGAGATSPPGSDPDDDVERGDEVGRGTRAFGPRPPRQEEEAPRGRPLVAGLTVVVLVAAAVAAGLWVRERLAERPAPREVSVAGAAGSDGTACPRFDPIPVPDGAEELSGDLAGDGCAHQVVWDGREMRFWLEEDDVQPRRYDFTDADGSPTAGQMLLGDWNCDGADTPALYRPSNGVVAYFSELPGRVSGQATASSDPTGVIDGRARLVPGGDGACDTVEVDAGA